jgi:hypothetical protein
MCVCFIWSSENTKIKIYRTIIVLIVLYGCETWLFTLREERRLRVLRRIFGPERDEVTGEWRKLHNEGLKDLYCSPNSVGGQIQKNEKGGACNTHEGEERCIQGFGGET